MERVEEIYFYEVFNINERLRDEIYKKYGTLYSAGKLLGKKRISLYHGIGSLKNLYEICTILDIDFGYCLTGKEKFKSYDLQRIIDIYKHSKRFNNDVSTRSIICCLQKDKTNIKIATLFKLSKILKKSIKDLIYA